MFPASDAFVCSPLPSSGSRLAPVPHLHRYYGFVRGLTALCWRSLVALDHHLPLPPDPCSLLRPACPCRPRPGPLLSGEPHPLLAGGDWRFSQVPGESVETCPGLGTPAAPDNLAIAVVQMLPSARLMTSASATKNISELNPRGPLPCCLRFSTRRSPGERQDSLPACQLRLWPGWTCTSWTLSKGFICSF